MKKGVLYCKDQETFNAKIQEIGIKNIANYIVLMLDYRDSWNKQLEGQEIDPLNCIGIDAANLIQYGAKIESVEPFKMEEIIYILVKAYKSYGNFVILDELSELKNKRCGVDVFMQFKLDMEKLFERAKKKIKDQKNN